MPGPPARGTSWLVRRFRSDPSRPVGHAAIPATQQALALGMAGPGARGVDLLRHDAMLGLDDHHGVPAS